VNHSARPPIAAIEAPGFALRKAPGVVRSISGKNPTSRIERDASGSKGGMCSRSSGLSITSSSLCQSV
jgi:hypothetical protein